MSAEKRKEFRVRLRLDREIDEYHTEIDEYHTGGPRRACSEQDQEEELREQRWWCCVGPVRHLLGRLPARILLRARRLRPGQSRATAGWEPCVWEYPCRGGCRCQLCRVAKALGIRTHRTGRSYLRRFPGEWKCTALPPKRRTSKPKGRR